MEGSREGVAEYERWNRGRTGRRWKNEVEEDQEERVDMHKKEEDQINQMNFLLHWTVMMKQGLTSKAGLYLIQTLHQEHRSFLLQCDFKKVWSKK